MTVQFGLIRMQAAAAICGLIAAQILTGAPDSLAQPFEVIDLGEGEEKKKKDGRKIEGKAGEDQERDRRGFEKGKIELEVNSAYQTGIPDDAEEPTRFASELSFGYAFADDFKVDGGIILTRERSEELTASNVALEVTYSPSLFHRDSDFGAGAFLALEPSIDDDATNEFVFGPIFDLRTEKDFQITVNPFFEKTFGRNREKGLAFAYGWQVKQEVSEGLAIGLEGFGEIEDAFGSPPDLDDQEHRLGPVIFLDGEERFGKEFEANFGVLAGLTSETPDVAFKLNFEISLGNLLK